MLSFLGIGAQKAGTTWLYEILRQHPELGFPAGKESHYWTLRTNARDAGAVGAYLALFQDPRRREGEITPAYAALDEAAIACLGAAVPQLRLIFMMRNPLERAWSAALMVLARLDMEYAEASDAWFLTLLRSRASLDRGDYATTIRRWCRWFPREALLHAVAVVKAGAFGLVRLVYDVFGIEFGEQLGVLAPLAVVAAVTIVWGSLRAVFQDDLKKRLAYSTVSQVSYIVLGTAVAGELSTVGGLVHLVHQGLMKITLFFCAGNLAETLGVHKVSEMGGAGRRMPLTMAAFTVGALGMMGLPPLAGFVSKWYLGVGALQAGQGWVIWVLAASALLNAAYFLPILRAAWFEPAPASWPHEETFRHETALGLLVPPLITALLVIAAGLFAGSDFSPLAWAKLVVAREYAH